ncbi:hypothetical protein [Isoptericola variabilis]|uniref:Uncharacterized protein n=1 Tax=Isoptericola variabilis (strain 225) TaxID=743718 RepID=F6FXD6_ISOV2|nr:hypothetical protein [Isoptericola variabilis]AEG44664.1 hypothetical protein Isova_1927 [Isoptericola variabilis 225]TWH33478.1 hypothetical protein L600_001700000570 [Isoptericola variabilis J7]
MTSPPAVPNPSDEASVERDGRAHRSADSRDVGLAVATGLVCVFGQVLVPAYLVWVAMWESWAASYDGVTAAGRPTAVTAVVVAAGAWLLQAIVTGYRRSRGGRAPSEGSSRSPSAGWRSSASPRSPTG